MRRNSSLALMIWPSFRENVMPTMLESPSFSRGEWILRTSLAGIILPLVRWASFEAEGGTISVAMSLCSRQIFQAQVNVRHGQIGEHSSVEHPTNELIGQLPDSLAE